MLQHTILNFELPDKFCTYLDSPNQSAVRPMSRDANLHYVPCHVEFVIAIPSSFVIIVMRRSSYSHICEQYVADKEVFGAGRSLVSTILL